MVLIRVDAYEDTLNAETSASCSSTVSAAAARSRYSLYSKSSVIRCSIESGSLKLTGIGILERSFRKILHTGRVQDVAHGVGAWGIFKRCPVSPTLGKIVLYSRVCLVEQFKK